jgi:hypothetical protein
VQVNYGIYGQSIQYDRQPAKDRIDMPNKDCREVVGIAAWGIAGDFPSLQRAGTSCAASSGWRYWQAESWGYSGEADQIELLIIERCRCLSRRCSCDVQRQCGLVAPTLADRTPACQAIR